MRACGLTRLAVNNRGQNFQRFHFVKTDPDPIAWRQHLQRLERSYPRDAGAIGMGNGDPFGA